MLEEQTEAFRNPLFRIIDGAQSNIIKLFFHSLLWRSATSRLSEFSEIEIDEIDLRKIGDMILSGDAGSHTFYPCLLSQISTRGLFHNHSPTTDLMEISKENENQLRFKTFRYYFDGLVAHILYDVDVAEAASFLDNDLFVGHSSRLIISTRTADDSRQYAQFTQAVTESAEMWPDHRF